jgi:PleD family two-component response regulator
MAQLAVIVRSSLRRKDGGVVVSGDMNAQVPERRTGFDRRRMSRGGRRPGDADGFAPLILVADDDVNSSARCEAILAKLKFAVAPAHSADEALRVMLAVRPNLIVSHLKDESRLRAALAAERMSDDVPIITVTPDIEDPATLVEAIRRVLRQGGGASV